MTNKHTNNILSGAFKYVINVSDCLASFGQNQLAQIFKLNAQNLSDPQFNQQNESFFVELTPTQKYATIMALDSVNKTFSFLDFSKEDLIQIRAITHFGTIIGESLSNRLSEGRL
ncbi:MULTISPECIES: hypothetical protein [unclassified Oleiphilus]|uniref:hypothetical protein n=1 Tax=unclassified Oleiphilus TaxID=2631174 RepID=UPI0007C27E0D|nr:MULTISPECIES: hypothetical protein [unclassified Oleiphilus]KZY32535.1 hypothetical protein A3729_07715 [Oleiphilus sp. HI0043]KZZ67588.1 hypothetical protein A3763_15850 [Oleiphilus sp. HI0128]